MAVLKNILLLVLALLGSHWLLAQTVPNGSFENGTAQWEPYQLRAGEVAFETVSGGSNGNLQARVNVIDQGRNTVAQSAASLGIISDFIPAFGGRDYDITVSLRGDATKRVRIAYQLFATDSLGEQGGTGVGPFIIISENETEYTRTFSVRATTPNDLPVRFIRLIIGTGESFGETFIDNVSIRSTIPDEDFDGFNAFEDCDDTDFFVNPGVNEILDNDVDENCDGIMGLTDVFGNLIPNFGFEEGDVNWEIQTASGADIDFQVFASSDAPEGDRHAFVSVNDQGTASSNQAASLGITSEYFPIQGGNTYDFSIQLKARPLNKKDTVNKSFQLFIFTDEGSRSGFDGIVIGPVFQLTEEWTTYEARVEIPELTFTREPVIAAQVLLGVGAEIGQVKIDDVRLQIVGGGEDLDGDGFVDQGDCDDNNPLAFPGASEIPDNDIDENCDGILVYLDKDRDRFTSDVDCDDNDPLINPNAIDIPNNDIDEDCDGILFNIDEDGDGAHSGIDCDDRDATRSPLFEEIFDNDIDENCDGIVAVSDKDGDGFRFDEDCDDEDPTVFPGAPEIKNNHIDENCDGVDESFFTEYEWLSEVIDQTDCDGIVIEFYRNFRGQLFVFIKEKEVQKLVHESGDVACLEHPLRSCLAFAGIKSSDLIGVWECPSNDNLTTPSTIRNKSSVPDNLKNKSFDIYPNPATNSLFIDLKEEAQIELINIHGQVIKTQKYNKGISKLDISDFGTGSYLVRFTKEKVTETIKVVITK